MFEIRNSNSRVPIGLITRSLTTVLAFSLAIEAKAQIREAAPMSSRSIPNGIYTLEPSYFAGYLQVYDANLKNASVVSKSRGRDRAEWQIERNSDGTYKIWAKHLGRGPAYFLQVDGAQYKSNVSVYTNVGHELHGRWYIDRKNNGTYALRPAHTSASWNYLQVDHAGGAGSNVSVYPNLGHRKHGQWIIRPVLEHETFGSLIDNFGRMKKGTGCPCRRCAKFRSAVKQALQNMSPGTSIQDVIEAVEREMENLENARLPDPRKWTELSDNKSDVRRSIRQGWNSSTAIVVFGKEFDHTDLAISVGALASSINSGNPGPMLAYLEYAAQQQLLAFKRNARHQFRRIANELSDQIIEDALERAIRGQAPQWLRVHGADIQVGLATYNHWKSLWTDYPEWKNNKVVWSRFEQKLELFPNTFQPYIRVRLRTR